MNPTLRGVALITLVGVASASRAEVLCTTRSGALRARAECKRHEKPVDFTALGPVGPKGATGDAGAPGPAVQVIDNAGQKLGQMTGGEGTPVLFTIGAVEVLFFTGGQGFQEFLVLEYEMANCAGPALLRSPLRPLVRFGQILGNTGYYPGNPIESHVVASRAQDSTPSDCTASGGTFSNGLCCESDPDTITAGPAVSLDMSAIVARFPATPHPIP